MTSDLHLDVSELAAPEPLERVLAALQTLTRGAYLRVVHRRQPQCLFGILDGMGFRHAWRLDAESRVQIWIWRGDDVDAQRAAELAAKE